MSKHTIVRDVANLIRGQIENSPHVEFPYFALNFRIALLVFVVMAIFTGACFLLTLAGSQGGWLPVKAAGYLFLLVFLLFLLTLFALAQLAYPQWVRFDWRRFWLDQSKPRRGHGDEG